MGYISVGKLAVASDLYEFVNQELLAGLSLSAEDFWAGFDKAVHELAPKGAALLAKRDDLQKQIDDYHIAHRDAGFDADNYQAFLKDIGYLVPEGPMGPMIHCLLYSTGTTLPTCVAKKAQPHPILCCASRVYLLVHF